MSDLTYETYEERSKKKKDEAKKAAKEWRKKQYERAKTKAASDRKRAKEKNLKLKEENLEEVDHHSKIDKAGKFRVDKYSKISFRSVEKNNQRADQSMIKKKRNGSYPKKEKRSFSDKSINKENPFSDQHHISKEPFSEMESSKNDMIQKLSLLLRPASELNQNLENASLDSDLGSKQNEDLCESPRPSPELPSSRVFAVLNGGKSKKTKR